MVVKIRGKVEDPLLSDRQIGSDNTDKWLLYLTHPDVGMA
jgi:hypothetical protein